MATTITYKGNEIANFESGIKTLKTSGKYCEGDITVESAGGVVPSGTLDITTNGEHDVTVYAKVNVDVHEPTPFAPSFVSFYRSGSGTYTTKITQDIIDSIDTSNIKSMTYMFSKTNFDTKKLDFSKWNVSNVKTFDNMFNEANNFDGGIFTGWDTSNATDMSYMFYYAQYMTELDISSFDTSNVTNMSYMFAYLSNLKKLILGSKFNTSNVTNMSYMFSSCGSSYAEENLFNFSNFDTKKVTTTNYMFYLCNAKKIEIPNFEYDSLTTCYSMFNNARSLETLNLGNNSVDKLSNVAYMFSSCGKLTNLTFFNNLGKGYTRTSSNFSNYKLDLSQSTLLTHDSLMDVINKLYDLNLTYDVANGGTLYAQQLVLGSTNMAKLSSEEIAIATSKGWTVS